MFGGFPFNNRPQGLDFQLKEKRLDQELTSGGSQKEILASKFVGCLCILATSSEKNTSTTKKREK